MHSVLQFAAENSTYDPIYLLDYPLPFKMKLKKSRFMIAKSHQ